MASGDGRGRTKRTAAGRHCAPRGPPAAQRGHACGQQAARQRDTEGHQRRATQGGQHGQRASPPG